MITDSDRLLSIATQSLDRRDAEILLASSWGKSRAQLLAAHSDPVPTEVATRFEDLCRQRATGIPLAYLLGRREFWSMEFIVGPAVLVPRPETELLVERILALVTAPAAEVADLGTGSGAIAIALATERPAWRITATDASAAALEIARKNGERLARNRVEWQLGDWYAPLAGRRFHAIASNPPYIAADDPALQADGVRHEPRGALTPGGDGTSAIATLINEAPRHLHPGGWLALEHGSSQGETLRSLLEARGFTHVTSHRDLAGHERITEAMAP